MRVLCVCERGARTTGGSEAGGTSSTRSAAGPPHARLARHPCHRGTRTRVSADAPPGRSIVTRRAIVDLVRAATLGSYGVTGFAHRNPAARLAAAMRLAPAGMRVRLGPGIDIDLWLAVAWGLPVAEVARQVDSAVRYALKRGVGREVDSLVIHVHRLQVPPPTPVSVPAAVVASALPSAVSVSGSSSPSSASGSRSAASASGSQPPPSAARLAPPASDPAPSRPSRHSARSGERSRTG